MPNTRSISALSSKDSLTALTGEIDVLLATLLERPRDEERITELSQIIRNAGTGQTLDEIRQLQEQTMAEREAIQALNEKLSQTLGNVTQVAARVRQFLVGLTTVDPTSEPLLDGCEEVINRYQARLVSPDTFLLRLRGLIREASSGLTAAATEAAPAKNEVGAKLSPDETPEAEPRLRKPDLETSRTRLALQQQLRQELATVQHAVKKYTTVQKLKTQYPAFRLWKILPESEQHELLEGNFKPRAYADTLVLRQYGLTSRETLKKDRQKLRDAQKRTSPP